MATKAGGPYASPVDPRLLTQEQRASIVNASERFTYSGFRRVLDQFSDNIAALEQQRAEALAIAKMLPHSRLCSTHIGNSCDCSRGTLIEKLGGER